MLWDKIRSSETMIPKGNYNWKKIFKCYNLSDIIVQCEGLKNNERYPADIIDMLFWDYIDNFPWMNDDDAEDQIVNMLNTIAKRESSDIEDDELKSQEELGPICGRDDLPCFLDKEAAISVYKYFYGFKGEKGVISLEEIKAALGYPEERVIEAIEDLEQYKIIKIIDYNDHCEFRVMVYLRQILHKQ